MVLCTMHALSVGNFHFRRTRISPIPLSPKWIFHRKLFKVENNRFCLNDVPLINYIITKWHGSQVTWLPSDMVTKWHLEGVGVGVVLLSGVDFRVRCIARTDTHVSWLPCHLVMIQLINGTSFKKNRLFSTLNDFRWKICFGESGFGEIRLRRNSCSAKKIFGESGLIRVRRS
jgi:hypothetical protein